MDSVLQHIVDAMNSNKSAIGMVLVVLFSLAKVVSNEKAGSIVGKIQSGVDMVAKCVSDLGKVLQVVSDMLADAIKSDGLFGKK